MKNQTKNEMPKETQKNPVKAKRAESELE